jgi:hypothetical protein
MQRDPAPCRARKHAVRVQAAHHGLAALIKTRFQIAAHQAKPIAIDRNLVFRIHGGDGILAILNGGQRAFQGDISNARRIVVKVGSSLLVDQTAGLLKHEWLEALVDDLADSGVTLRAVVERLRSMPAISELRTAVIWVKGVSSYVPEYFVETLPTSPWIHQPFEEYDGLRPAELAKRYVI